MSEPRDHSEYMQQIIDEEVARILREADEHAYRLLDEHRDELERLTESLIEREVLTEAEISSLIGKRESVNGQDAASRRTPPLSPPRKTPPTGVPSKPSLLVPCRSPAMRWPSRAGILLSCPCHMPRMLLRLPPRSHWLPVRAWWSSII